MNRRPPLPPCLRSSHYLGNRDHFVWNVCIRNRIRHTVGIKVCSLKWASSFLIAMVSKSPFQIANRGFLWSDCIFLMFLVVFYQAYDYEDKHRPTLKHNVQRLAQRTFRMPNVTPPLLRQSGSFTHAYNGSARAQPGSMTGSHRPVTVTPSRCGSQPIA